MNMVLEVIKSVILGVIQGVTEWLPISSTGHMILFNDLWPLNFSKAFTDLFLVVIQFGSILAVIVLFFHKLNPFSPKKTTLQKRQTWSLWLKVLVASVPVAVIGLVFEEKIDALFYNAPTVAVALIVYGIAFLFIERPGRRPAIRDVEHINGKTALLIGVFQVLALIPGTSRSGSTILAAVLLGCSRYAAAEFSFFLAIPAMLGASGLKILKYGFHFSSEELLVLAVGFVVAFLVSLVVVRFLMNFVKKHDFKVFGWYRIALGLVVLLYFFVLRG